MLTPVSYVYVGPSYSTVYNKLKIYIYSQDKIGVPIIYVSPSGIPYISSPRITTRCFLVTFLIFLLVCLIAINVVCMYFTRSQDVTLTVYLMVGEIKLRERFEREQHVERASRQSQGWIRATHIDKKLSKPSDSGWTKDIHGWTPLWTTLPQAAKSCYELIHCGCTKGCVGCCKCVKAGLKCRPTALCACSGECER